MLNNSNGFCRLIRTSQNTLISQRFKEDRCESESHFTNGRSLEIRPTVPFSTKPCFTCPNNIHLALHPVALVFDQSALPRLVKLPLIGTVHGLLIHAYLIVSPTWQMTQTGFSGSVEIHIFVNDGDGYSVWCKSDSILFLIRAVLKFDIEHEPKSFIIGWCTNIELF